MRVHCTTVCLCIVDLWSFECVMAELLTKQVIFLETDRILFCFLFVFFLSLYHGVHRAYLNSVHQILVSSTK